MVKRLSKIIVPESYNYIGVFLTYACNMHCPYCINRHGRIVPKGVLRASSWIRGLNRIASKQRLPVTLQGGEPTIHPDFYRIVNGISADLDIDLLTNGLFNARQFTTYVDKSKMSRDAKYASIRFSYHPGQTDWPPLLANVLYMLESGYSVGIWAVDHPEYRAEVRIRKDEAEKLGIDFRLKEFLGEHKGILYGTYRYSGAVSSPEKRACLCKPSELLIDPKGDIYRCHRDLYAGEHPIGNMLDSELVLPDEHYLCTSYGNCNPCDIKVKFNRFQEPGHCSVDIIGIGSSPLNTGGPCR